MYNQKKEKALDSTANPESLWLLADQYRNQSAVSGFLRKLSDAARHFALSDEPELTEDTKLKAFIPVARERFVWFLCLTEKPFQRNSFVLFMDFLKHWRGHDSKREKSLNWGEIFRLSIRLDLFFKAEYKSLKGKRNR